MRIFSPSLICNRIIEFKIHFTLKYIINLIERFMIMRRHGYKVHSYCESHFTVFISVKNLPHFSAVRRIEHVMVFGLLFEQCIPPS